MTTRDSSRARRWIYSVMCIWGLALGLLTQADALPEQRVEVTIKDFTFITKQLPLQLNMPILIVIRNADGVRHDFGSSVFQGNPTEVESDGVVSYGTGIQGVFLNPTGDAMIRLTIGRPGRYEFKCSIHPDMKGELLLMSIGAV